MDLIKYDDINEDVKIDRIFPSLKRGEFVKCIDQTTNDKYLLELFEGNNVTAFNLGQETLIPIEFGLPTNEQLNQIVPNPNINQLAAFKNDSSYCVINLNTFRLVKKGEGKFFWRGYD